MSQASTSTGESTSGSSASDSGSSPVPRQKTLPTGSATSSSDSGSSSESEADEGLAPPATVEQPSEDEADETAPKWIKPKGFSLIPSSTSTTFDFEQVAKDPNLELWLFKVPEGVKPKHVSELHVPPEASTSKDPLGSFHARKADYELVEVTNDKKSAGNGEMLNLQPLLPRQDIGRLQLCTKGISRRFVVQHAMIQPTPLPGAEEEEKQAPEGPLKRAQPASLSRVRNQLGNWNSGDVPTQAHKKRKTGGMGAGEDVDMDDASSPAKKHKKHSSKKEGHHHQAHGDVSMEVAQTDDASEKSKKKKKRKEQAA